jgi:hypothetical protein
MKINRLGERNYKWREVNNMKKILCLFCLLLGLFITANASADLVLTLGIPDNTSGGLQVYPSPYATVDISLNAGNIATVTFTGESGVPYDSTTLNYLLGDGSIADLNVNGSFTASLPTGYALDPNANSHVDGFGHFTLTINQTATPNGYTTAVPSLTFTITKSSGAWLDVNDVLMLNSAGYLAAAHIYVQDDNNKSAALTTGFAANGTRVPEPSTLLLLGAGLLGVGFVRRRFKK